MGKPNVFSYEEEKKKNPELKESDIQALREWCAKQPFLPKITDSELALFLHSNYYSMEPTKSTIDTYYTVRTHVPEFFSNRDPISSKELRKIFDTIYLIPLEKRTKEGYTVIFGRLRDSDPSNYNYNDHMKYLTMNMDLWTLETGPTVGHVICFDVSNLALGHAARVNPLGLKKFLVYLQDGMPVRLKQLHFVNMSSVMEMIINMARPFMKKELLDIMRCHTSVEAMEQFLPLDIFPNEIGGKAGALEDLHSARIKKLESCRDWFLEEQETARVDESKRPGKGKTATDLFGVEGSFKKLDID